MIKRSALLFTPIIIFSIIWGVTISLYLYNPFQLDTIRDYTVFILGLGISMVFIGFYTAKFLNDGFKIKEYRSQIEDFPFPINKVKKLVIILTTISLIGTFGNLYLITNAVGGLDVFIVDPGYVRNFILKLYLGSGDVPINKVIFKIFSYMSSLISITVIIAGAISTRKGMRLVSIYPLILTIIISIANLQRYFFIQHYFFWLISSFVFIYYYPSHEQKKAFRSFLWQLLTFIFVSVIFAISILIIRYLLSPGFDFEKLFNSFYFYIAGNIFLLDKYLLTDPEPYYGLSFFRSFIKWFVAFGLMDNSAILSPHYEFYKLYNIDGNTFGFFRVPYEDFNILGIIIIPYLWGWSGYYVMKKYLEKFTFVRLGIVAIILFSFFLSFFGFSLLGFTSIAWKLFLFSVIDRMILNNYNKSLRLKI